jgi:hypothetical protein
MDLDGIGPLWYGFCARAGRSFLRELLLALFLVLSKEDALLRRHPVQPRLGIPIVARLGAIGAEPQF